MSRGKTINVPKSYRLSVRICAYIGIGPKVYTSRTKGSYLWAKAFIRLHEAILLQEVATGLHHKRATFAGRKD